MMTSALTNSPMPRRRLLVAGAAAAAAALGNFAALGQTASSAKLERLRILCTGPAGSVPDIIARTYAEALASVFARQVLVDNRPGAAGQIAVQALKSAPADGSTWLLGQGAIASLYRALYAKLGYDPVRDLVPVSLAAEMSLGVAVGPAVPARVVDTRMLVDWMRHHPGEANAASPGTGTLPHILEAMLFDHAGLDWRHVPYPGGPPAVAALLGGQVAVLVLPEGLLLPQLASGRLRLLGTSGPGRSRFSPTVPTLAEQGHARSVMREWFAFFAPAGTPAGIVQQASEAVGSVAVRTALRRLEDAAMMAVQSSPAQLAAKVEEDRRTWAPLLVDAGIRGDA